jgi:hypothetical protein
LFSLSIRPPLKGVPGVIDQTRGLLNYVEKNCAPAVYTPGLRYVCIAGRYFPFRLGFQDLLYCFHIDLVIELCCGLHNIYFAEDAKLLKTNMV